MRERVYLGLGSNVGDRLGHLTQALRLLAEREETLITGWSSVYETEPVGYTNQPYFLNMAVELETKLSPEHLLAATREIECNQGRVREIHWGPRTLDIDILLYGDRVYADENLVIPHPRMTERAFVMIPLAELSPGLVIPGYGETVAVVAGRLKGKNGVKRWMHIESDIVFVHTEN